MQSPNGERRGPGRQPRDADPATDQTMAELFSDPDHMSRRLAEDVASVAALRRGEVTVDPRLEAGKLVAALRAEADGLAFESPVAAAAATLRHIGELPLAERLPETAESRVAAGSEVRRVDEVVRPYHESASTTVADGEVAREWMREDGGIELVFQRQATEPNDTGVLVEATVLVRPSGEAFLVSYGWPTRAVDHPVFRFSGAAAGYVQQLFVDLAAASGTPQAFERAMLMAYGAMVATGREGGLPAEVVQPAQREVLRLAVRQARLLGGYLEDAIDLAERGGLAEWMSACVRRSAAESLFAGFLGSAAFELVTPGSLEDLERAIADAAAELPAADRRALTPVGTPGSHEWWLAER